ncbi:MAG: DEAD/DEAH box helicase family protein [Dehalobacterium sp.]
MNRTVTMIKNRLSLRSPQEESLNILDEIVNKLTLQKESNLEDELAKVKAMYPTCVDFERNFPSICFSLATGVGKTRLMGAFITYLYIEKGIRNFFVLAPNLTIYNKLIDDFDNPQNPKYVFRGIGEFIHNRPKVITGDTYKKQAAGQGRLFIDVTINVFNISKINAETKGGKEPLIKRLSEYIGQSYFEYLSNLPDLVILMDESHHYRADRGMQVINELNPVLGLELTATPQVERSGNTVKFKNVVYEFSLAKAIRDGFVKEPFVATRKDFDPGRYSEEDLDIIKLEDGVRIHEATKVELDIFARDNKVKIVKPFVLVVAKDTDHARKLKELIMSNQFFDGRYRDKVMEIHSNQRGGEKEENIELLLSLEKTDNPIEIVIHVNMLKEGWDVTNLYTIIPLRTAASSTLREQTIGRGLRLPYGNRTGYEMVDRLTIISHDKFQEIVDIAMREDSLFRRENIIELDEQDLNESKEVITSTSVIEQELQDEAKRIEFIKKPEEKQKAVFYLEAKKNIVDAITHMNRQVTSISDLTKPKIKEIAINNIKNAINKNPQQTLFTAEIIGEVEKTFDIVVDDYRKNIIEIPRISLVQKREVKSGFYDFDLDVMNLNFQPSSEQIMIQRLSDGKSFEIETVVGKVVYDSLENIIVNELVNYSEIDYDQCAVLLFKLARQAVTKLSTYLEEHGIINVIQSHKREVGRYIYTQMMEHFYCEAQGYEKPVVYPFDQIYPHNYSKYSKDDIYHYSTTINPTSDIPKKVFTGFLKSCHNLYKFDSKTEKDFAVILEQEKNTVLKWLRPAQNQFRIYWDHNSKQYHPDFVVECPEIIYMVETKKATDINSDEVQAKKRAALEYCKNATEFTTKHGGKPWKYVLIPHGMVMINISFENLVEVYG